ncbi:uncharacterized protein EI97DRAFT_215293 [Westerdykella ornata]|uniref:Uncharacterized protein n=1 Tax=Westerdykella ornata TaxID=318751 RepID=A0A6A6JPP0_WESOR|nr:uncharacterized protein EI97DRAFT_215293 [Westerdykella ornata]KAF2278620.1 hypothetical protein EI97DRAFT_215293 [Westerdykella ornata]
MGWGGSCGKLGEAWGEPLGGGRRVEGAGKRGEGATCITSSINLLATGRGLEMKKRKAPKFATHLKKLAKGSRVSRYRWCVQLVPACPVNSIASLAVCERLSWLQKDSSGKVQAALLWEVQCVGNTNLLWKERRARQAVKGDDRRDWMAVCCSVLQRRVAQREEAMAVCEARGGQRGLFARRCGRGKMGGTSIEVGDVVVFVV